MALRKAKNKNPSSDIDISIMELSPDEHHEDESELEENLSALKNCMEQLKESQKKCVELFFLKKKCYQEIVSITSYPLKKVKSYIQNGKRNLKICIEKSAWKEKPYYLAKNKGVPQW